MPIKTPIDALLDSLEWRELSGDVPKSGLYAVKEAVLTIACHSLRCYVLNNGQRIIHAGDLAAFFACDEEEQPDA